MRIQVGLQVVEKSIDFQPPVLYQAQHLPVYYGLHSPIYQHFRPTDLPRGIMILRSVNLAYAAMTLAVFGWLLCHWLPHQPHWAHGAVLLLALHPLFLINAVRVSNDTLAILLATGAIAVVGTGQLTFRRVLFGTLVFAFAGTVKATAWTLIPAFGYLVWMRGDYRKALLALFCVGLFLMGILYVHFRIHGHFSLTQESYHLAEQGASIGRRFHGISEIDWAREWSRRLGRELLWVGGWSFLPLPKIFTQIHQWLVAGLVLLGLVRGFPSGLSNRTGVFCLLACLGTLFGMSLHMLETRAAYGFVGTPVWYAAGAIPWFLLLLASTTKDWKRVYVATVLVLSGLFFASECWGIWGVMTPFYSSRSPPVGYHLMSECCAGALGILALFLVVKDFVTSFRERP
jgi:hypothetical protein